MRKINTSLVSVFTNRGQTRRYFPIAIGVGILANFANNSATQFLWKSIRFFQDIYRNFRTIFTRETAPRKKSKSSFFLGRPIMRAWCKQITGEPGSHSMNLSPVLIRRYENIPGDSRDPGTVSRGEELTNVPPGAPISSEPQIPQAVTTRKLFITIWIS